MTLRNNNCCSSLTDPKFGKPITIFVWENGDFDRNEQKVKLDASDLRTWSGVLNYLTGMLQPRFGAVRKLYHLGTKKMVDCLKDIQPYERYVAVGGEKFKFKTNGYLTEAERQLFQKSKCSRKCTRLQRSSIDFMDYTEKKNRTVIYCMVSGRTCQEPLKVVLTPEDLNAYTMVLDYLGSRLDLEEGVQFLCKTNGRIIFRPEELHHGELYVAVPFNGKFVSMDYSKLFEELRPKKTVKTRRPKKSRSALYATKSKKNYKNKVSKCILHKCDSTCEHQHLPSSCMPTPTTTPNNSLVGLCPTASGHGSSFKVPSSTMKAPSSVRDTRSTGRIPSSTIKTTSSCMKSASTVKPVSSCTLKVPSSTVEVYRSSDKVPSTNENVQGCAGQVSSCMIRVPTYVAEVPSATVNVPSSTTKVAGSTAKVPNSEVKVPSSTPVVSGSVARTPRNESLDELEEEFEKEYFEDEEILFSSVTNLVKSVLDELIDVCLLELENEGILPPPHLSVPRESIPLSDKVFFPDPDEKRLSLSETKKLLHPTADLFGKCYLGTLGSKTSDLNLVKVSKCIHQKCDGKCQQHSLASSCMLTTTYMLENESRKSVTFLQDAFGFPLQETIFEESETTGINVEAKLNQEPKISILRAKAHQPNHLIMANVPTPANVSPFVDEKHEEEFYENLNKDDYVSRNDSIVVTSSRLKNMADQFVAQKKLVQSGKKDKAIQAFENEEAVKNDSVSSNKFKAEKSSSKNITSSGSRGQSSPRFEADEDTMDGKKESGIKASSNKLQTKKGSSKNITSSDSHSQSSSKFKANTEDIGDKKKSVIKASSNKFQAAKSSSRNITSIPHGQFSPKLEVYEEEIEGKKESTIINARSNKLQAKDSSSKNLTSGGSHNQSSPKLEPDEKEIGSRNESVIEASSNTFQAEKSSSNDIRCCDSPAQSLPGLEPDEEETSEQNEIGIKAKGNKFPSEKSFLKKIVSSGSHGQSLIRYKAANEKIGSKSESVMKASSNKFQTEERRFKDTTFSDSYTQTSPEFEPDEEGINGEKVSIIKASSNKFKAETSYPKNITTSGSHGQSLQRFEPNEEGIEGKNKYVISNKFQAETSSSKNITTSGSHGQSLQKFEPNEKGIEVKNESVIKASSNKFQSEEGSSQNTSRCGSHDQSLTSFEPSEEEIEGKNESVIKAGNNNFQAEKSPLKYISSGAHDQSISRFKADEEIGVNSEANIKVNSNNFQVEKTISKNITTSRSHGHNSGTVADSRNNFDSQINRNVMNSKDIFDKQNSENFINSKEDNNVEESRENLKMGSWQMSQYGTNNLEDNIQIIKQALSGNGSRAGKISTLDKICLRENCKTFACSEIHLPPSY